ncbi:FAD-dependent monooxygenase [Muriicola sp. Z0-33]|nr:FAD-dependent monooxygenase [Muriicola sp. Z0-33]
MKIDIIGAGICGLTTAIALKEKGFDVQVFEQAKEIKPVGAGIIIANNAMQVFEKFGLKNIIAKNGNPISCVKISKPNLDEISKINLEYFEHKFGVGNIAISRGVLQQILSDRLGSESIILDHKLNRVIKSTDGFQLDFENGGQQKSNILLAADGLNSIIRKNLFQINSLRKTNQLCWRGITPYQLPLKLRNELNEAWGKGDRFGFVQISKSEVYWFAVKSFVNKRDELSVNKIDEYFGNYHPIIKELISLTPKEKIHTDELIDLKPIKNWSSGNVCLIGDAAHATTPNMGQGACQAIEDAYVLAECLGKYSPEKAFRNFQKIRFQKVNQVVKTSWALGKVAHFENPLAVNLRNRIFRLTPESVNRKKLDKIFNLDIN